MRQSDTEDFLHDHAVIQGNGAQLCPILALAPVDYVVEGSQGVLPMIQMPVQHGLPISNAPVVRGAFIPR